MQTIQLQPLSVLAGLGLGLAGFLTVGQSAAPEPGVLEVRELRVVDADGQVLVRIGSSDAVSAGLWMLDPKGVERISMELEGYPDETEDALGMSRLIMRNRSGEEVVQLGQHDGTHHGDVEGLNLGVTERTDGVEIASYAGGSRLSLGGEFGRIEMNIHHTGPYFHLSGEPTKYTGVPVPFSSIYMGRQLIGGFEPGSLVTQFVHGGGIVGLSIGADGKPKLRMTDAEDEVVEPEHP